ncbi:MAG: hypothetical protein LWX07_01320 [Bacteroidetes bacterium]|nr:hypothetical protein [Bacteroidota bacterium]
MSADSTGTDSKKANPLLSVLAVLCFLGAIITFVPYKNIDDACMLGYKALCAFTPVSSLVLIVAGAAFWMFRKKF